jgi:hypothetical protein
MKITKSQYENALKTIEAFKIQENQAAFEKEKYTASEFDSFYGFPGLPNIGDICLIPIDGHDGCTPHEEKIFERATITGRFGRDEFFSTNEAGKNRYFLDTDTWKIVSKSEKILAA